MSSFTGTPRSGPADYYQHPEWTGELGFTHVQRLFQGVHLPQPTEGSRSETRRPSAVHVHRVRHGFHEGIAVNLDIVSHKQEAHHQVGLGKTRAA